MKTKVRILLDFMNIVNGLIFVKFAHIETDFTAMFFIHTLQRRALGKIVTEREVKFMPIENVKNIGFVFDIGEDKIFESVKYLTSFLNDKKIDYKGLAINLTKNKFPDFVLGHQIQLITRKDVSFIGTPNPQLIEKFIKEKIDLYIDFCSSYSYTHDFIARSSIATFKVGHSNNNNHPFDLVIGNNSIENSPLYYIKQVIHYLTAIKSA